MVGPYLVDSLTLKTYTGTDVLGTPTTRGSVTVPCYITYKNEQVTSIEGQIVVSKAFILMRPWTIIRTGFSTRAAKTIAYEDIMNFDGVDHAIIQIAKDKDFSTRALRVYVR